jgi:transcriptional regulator with XRE-family HTH domain
MASSERSQSAEDRYRQAAGVVFRALRSKQGWSLRDFGERVGAAHTTLYAVERGETTPGIDVLDRVAAAFGMDLSALLSMIVDELHEQSGGQPDSLPGLVFAFSRLTPEQRREALQFVDYLQYRSGNPRTDKDIAAG